MAIFAPSRAKTRAISLPMPLAAPVTTATLSFRRMGLSVGSRQVIVDDLAELEREVGDDVRAGHDLEHRQLVERRKRVREQGQLGRPALEIDVAQIVFDQLADARRAV